MQGFITPVYGCSGDRNAFSERFHPGWNADWTSRGLDHEKTTGALECAIWIDHPVLVNQRDTFANFFHDSEDFFNVFLGMAVLQWNFQDTQVGDLSYVIYLSYIRGVHRALCTSDTPHHTTAN
jgi:hypothetical protein